MTKPTNPTIITLAFTAGVFSHSLLTQYIDTQQVPEPYRQGVHDVLTSLHAQDLVGLCGIVEDYKTDERINPYENTK